MAIAFRPAVRSNVGLFVGLAGETGSGKTMSGMKLCQGIVGRANRFAVIDCENKRASHYAPVAGQEPDFITTFRFDVLDFAAPFTSERYEEMVKLAVSSGYKAIMLDSASHEHDSVGGYLDRQAEDLQQRVDRYMKKYPDAREWDVIEKLTPSSWAEPKKARNRMMETLLACSTTIPIIFCFRAQEKVFSTKDGKLVANNPPLWAPICGKGMPFEMTAFFMMHATNPGVPVPLKLQAQHKALFPLDRAITEESGRLIAAWASGGAQPSAPAALPSAEPRAIVSAAPSGADLAFTPNTDVLLDLGDQPPSQCLTVDQVIFLTDRCREHAINTDALSKAAGVRGVGFILQANYDRANQWIDKQIERRKVKA